MKSSLRKLRELALHKSTDHKEKRDYGIPAREDELRQASEDVLDMRNFYECLLSAAAATANSAYEFSEALQEMGICLLEKTSFNDDKENGQILLMLGQVQLELQKLLDIYRIHIIQTITMPSESLLKELQTVEEMKRQCDDKHDLYKSMLVEYREKGRSGHAKVERFSSQQLQAAREDYEEETNLFFFRLKSLRQGQSRSLLTQAARHHAAQLNFFRKGVESLDLVEPCVKMVAEQNHIDYNFIELEDNAIEDDEDYDYGNNGNDDWGLSFDYGQNEHIQDVDSTFRNAMEDAPAKGHLDLHCFGRDTKSASQSAPILPEMKFEPSEGIKHRHASSLTKFHSYVLPTPVDAKHMAIPASRNSLAAKSDSKTEWPIQLRHSSPLQPKELPNDLNDEMSSPIKSPISHAVLKENNLNTDPNKLLPSLAERFSILQSDTQNTASYYKKIRRQAFSGPLSGKSWSSYPRLSANESPQSVEYPHPMLSSKINDLHELPRPPISSAKLPEFSDLFGHSGPLVPRSRGLYVESRMLSNTASPLPKPPAVMARSYSIPSNGLSKSLLGANFVVASHNAAVLDDISSLSDAQKDLN